MSWPQSWISPLQGYCMVLSASRMPPSFAATIESGLSTLLAVVAIGSPPLNYQWYQGLSGDTSNPIGGATLPAVNTPTLTETTSYWVRVSNLGGLVDSNTATVEVTGDWTNPNLSEILSIDSLDTP